MEWWTTWMDYSYEMGKTEPGAVSGFIIGNVVLAIIWFIGVYQLLDVVTSRMVAYKEGEYRTKYKVIRQTLERSKHEIAYLESDKLQLKRKLSDLKTEDKQHGRSKT